MTSDFFEKLNSYDKPEHYHFFYLYEKKEHYQMISGDPEILKILGYDFNEISDNEIDIIQYIHPEDKILVLNTYDEILNSGGKYDIYYRILNSKGAYLEVRDIGSRTICKYKKDFCLGGSIRLVPSSEESYMLKLSNIIQAASKQGDLGVYYFRISDQKIFWTTQLLSIYGLNDEPTIEEYWELVLKEYREKSKFRLNKIIQNPQKSKSLYKIQRKTDGAIRTLFTTTSPLFNEQGKLFAFSGTTIDITDLLEILNFESEVIFKSINERLKVQDEAVIFVKHNNNHISIPINDIIAISALRDYIQVYVRNVKLPYVIYKTLKEMFEKLPKDQFIQVHRSHIINLKEISKVENNNVLLSDLSFPISRTYWPFLKKKLEI
jgi:PAS domain S-box-containing protein